MTSLFLQAQNRVSVLSLKIAPCLPSASPSFEEVRLVRVPVFREPHQGVSTGSHGGRNESRQKIFAFMPKGRREVTQS